MTEHRSAGDVWHGRSEGSSEPRNKTPMTVRNERSAGMQAGYDEIVSRAKLEILLTYQFTQGTSLSEMQVLDCVTQITRGDNAD